MSNPIHNSQPCVSVIIPVWNPGPGISRCIESLRNQTLKDIEMIFVDDCGTDDSMDRVREEATNDFRIQILKNEENIGAGPSRNRGIESARGEYLSFVDADDYLASDFLELLYTKAHLQSFDIVKGCLVRNKKDGTSEKALASNQQIRKGLSEGKPLYTVFLFQHQSAVYRKEFLLAHKVRYGSSRRSEDVSFLLYACSKAKTFSFMDDAHYYLCERSDSTTNTRNVTQLFGILLTIHERIDYILNELPEDTHAYSYLKKAFLDAIRGAERYRDIPGMNDSLSAYFAELRREWNRLPYRKNLSKDSFSLRCLEEYGIALPPRPEYSVWGNKNLPTRYAKLVELWTDFFLEHPKEEQACWKELKPLIIQADNAMRVKAPSMYCRNEQEQGKTLLRKQIKRLPFSIQVQLKLSRTKERVKRSISKALLNRLRQTLACGLVQGGL